MPDNKTQPEPALNLDATDYEVIYTTVSAVLAEAHDILFHHVADESWMPEVDGDPVLLLARGEELLGRLTAAVRDAYRNLDDIEHASRERDAITNGDTHS